MSEPFSPLATPRATREILASYGLATKKALGQNFLVNDVVVGKILQLAELSRDDGVLEVGPGIGTLTIALLKEAGRVLAVERDRDLPQVLRRTCAPWADRLSLLNMDALDLMPERLPFEPTKLVSNLPYAVAARIVLDAFERFASIHRAVVMVQSEVADRMMASPGSKDYGAYTVKLRFYANPTGRFQVSAGNFLPPPRVESSVIRLERGFCELSDAERRAACIMADASFATRRKTIVNSCKGYFSSQGAPGAAIAGALDGVFAAAGIDKRRRGESLSLEEFARLGKSALPYL